MSEIAVIGEHPVVAGFALAGARTYAADDPGELRAAWHALPATVGIVILTPFAAEVLQDERPPGVGPLTVVMPL